MNQILQETKQLMTQQKEKFIANATGELKVLLESIWNEFMSNKKHITFPIEMNKYQTEFESRGLSCKLGVHWSAPTFVIYWE